MTDYTNFHISDIEKQLSHAIHNRKIKFSIYVPGHFKIYISRKEYKSLPKLELKYVKISPHVFYNTYRYFTIPLHREIVDECIRLGLYFELSSPQCNINTQQLRNRSVLTLKRKY